MRKRNVLPVFILILLAVFCLALFTAHAEEAETDGMEAAFSEEEATAEDALTEQPSAEEPAAGEFPEEDTQADESFSEESSAGEFPEEDTQADESFSEDSSAEGSPEGTARTDESFADEPSAEESLTEAATTEGSSAGETSSKEPATEEAPALPADSESGGILDDISFIPGFANEGFTVPVPEDQNRFAGEAGSEGSLVYLEKEPANGSRIGLTYTYSQFLDFWGETGYAEENYRALEESLSDEILEKEIISLQEHPAFLAVYTEDNRSEGVILYARNNWLLSITVISAPEEGTAPEKLPRVAMKDLKKLAEQIVYDPAKASITAADGALTVTAQNGLQVLPGGKKLQFTATFANPARVNKKAKNNTVMWSAVDTATGQPAENVTISAKGKLTVSKKLLEAMDIEVTASSPIFHSSAKYPLRVIPTVEGIRVNPQELTFYEGEDRRGELEAVLMPATVPRTGMTWQDKPSGVVEISPTEDGSASVRPLKAGRTVITVSEPNGKKAKVRVSVLVPVESLELTVRGKPRPGKSVNVTAGITPKNAENIAVEWSIDASDDTAVINAKGRLKISKTAKPGTVITVTCKAVGAPEPVIAEKEITVEE